ncbi:outer membrane usher protein [Salmonella enterica]|nr:outer membrane usher protein [Salmonella enterica]
MKIKFNSLFFTSVSVFLPAVVYAASPSDTNEEYVEFNNSFLMGDAKGIDISRFSEGNNATAGQHKVDIYVNGKMRRTETLEFPDNGKGTGTPCLTRKVLDNSGINTEKLPAADANQCVVLSKTIDHAQVAFDNNEQRVDIQVPQEFEKVYPPGYVDPTRRDDGINAGFVSWNWNDWHSQSHGDSSQSLYVGTNYGLNLGAWRVRASGSFNQSNDASLAYSSNQAYLQREVTPLNAQVVLGDTYTRSDIFDSLDLRGVRLYNDNRMLPGGNTAYTPVIHGNARTNAKVTVRQGADVIYQTTVTPGSFELKDINAAFNGNDLDVTVEETDGSKQHFSVPFSSVTQLLREGMSSWEVGVGEVNRDDVQQKPKLVMGTYSRGLSSVFTGYSGFQVADNSYYSDVLGVAANTPLGAVAVDVTHSSMDLTKSGNWSGESYRVSYSKMLDATGTSFNMVGWRYSTGHYLSLDDAVVLDDEQNDSDLANEEQFHTTKNRFQLNLSQPLKLNGESYGDIYVSSNWSNYWGSADSTTDYSIGYSNTFALGSYSISAQRTWSDTGETNDSLSLSLNIPLDNLLAGGSEQHHAFSSLNMNYNTDLKGNDQFNSSASGTSADNLLNYSVSGAVQQQRNNDTLLSQIGTSISYNTVYGTLNGSASTSAQGDRQLSVGGNGGMLVHRHGVVFADRDISPTESFSLLEAPGAEGSGTGGVGGKINSAGYGLSESLSPYRDNTVGLDISTLKKDVEIDSTSAQVVPTNGAITLVKFNTKAGQSYALQLLTTPGQDVPPMGAQITDDKGTEVGMVGQGGEAFLRGVEKAGALTVRWGDKPEQQCGLNYQPDANAGTSRMTIMLPAQPCVAATHHS